MKVPWKKYMICTAALLIAAFICMGIANAIQTGGGSIELSEGVLESEYGSLAFKLYRPVKATAESPAPAVLLLHGYQNDRETGSAYAIELA
ncbi:MAG: hypothetical protein IJO77_07895, partial [Oscillospiraceae bacterium]|nr:hypothetical protein [Oscillospiraceae bacterium]